MQASKFAALSIFSDDASREIKGLKLSFKLKPSVAWLPSLVGHARGIGVRKTSKLEISSESSPRSRADIGPHSTALFSEARRPTQLLASAKSSRLSAMENDEITAEF